MATLLKYRFLVENDPEYKIDWLESAPLLWNGVNVVQESITCLAEMSDDAIQKVKIEKENTTTGGHYQSEFVHIESIASSKVSKDVVWEMPISLFSAQINIPAIAEGDEIEAIVSPDTIIGVVSESVSAGSNVINLSSEHIQNIFVGAVLAITDGSNVNDLGVIKEIDLVTGNVTMEKPSVDSFVIGSALIMNVYIVRRGKIANQGLFIVGRADIGGQYFPAGRILRINYYNNSQVNKNIGIFFEYLY